MAIGRIARTAGTETRSGKLRSGVAALVTPRCASLACTSGTTSGSAMLKSATCCSKFQTLL